MAVPCASPTHPCPRTQGVWLASWPHATPPLGGYAAGHSHRAPSSPTATTPISGFGTTLDAADLKLTGSFFKSLVTFPVLSAGGHDYESGRQYLDEGKADAVVYGRHYVSTPDLVARFKLGAHAKPNPYDRSTFYSPGPKGYNDYPTWSEVATASASL